MPTHVYSHSQSGAFGEPMSSSPLWLAHSGLPEWMNARINRNAWSVFKTTVEIDCVRNARPAVIEIPPADLARFCGLDAQAVSRALEGLRRKKCLALFLPEHPEENALIEIKIPLPTPLSPAKVREIFPFNLLDPSVKFRYAALDEEKTALSDSAAAAEKRGLQRVIDLYFNTVGLKMNNFILDELRLIVQRFSRAEVEKTFARAQKNDIRSLGWIARELYRSARRHDPNEKEKN